VPLGAFQGSFFVLISYLDESGDTGVLPNATSPVQPLFCLLSLAVEVERIPALTRDFLALKYGFFPGLFSGAPPLARILREIKGSDVRKVFRGHDRQQRRHHRVFLGRLLDIVEHHDARLFGRVWIKPIGGTFDGDPVYTFSAQAICRVFHNLLDTRNRRGIVIADSRTQTLNSRFSFSIFTQQFQHAGDPYPRIIERPTFAHSQNHAVLQVCDLLCSALVFPIGAYAYCSGFVTNVHVHPAYAQLRTEFGPRLRALEHRYEDNGRMIGGITVSDPIGGRNSAHLFGVRLQ